MKQIRCLNCGRDFMGKSHQKYCSQPECRKASRRAADHKYRKVIEKKTEYTVNNTCPKDCRFREPLAGHMHYCNYGDIALREGLAEKPIRGGTVKDCSVYESKSKVPQNGV